MLSDELAGDFRRVRDDFDQLNRGLRQSLMENEGSRGDVLDALFASVDLIGESEAGNSFSAFWRLLTDPEQSDALREALELVAQRPFARLLDARERKFPRFARGGRAENPIGGLRACQFAEERPIM